MYTFCLGVLQIESSTMVLSMYIVYYVVEAMYNVVHLILVIERVLFLYMFVHFTGYKRTAKKFVT